MTRHPRSVLFLCTGNSARSQLAEAALRHLAPSSFLVFSAGTDPQGVDERVYQVLRERDIPGNGLTSKRITDVPQDHFDFVITLCDQARQECGVLPQAPAVMHWDFSDPKSTAGVDAFRDTLAALLDHIHLFLLVNDDQNPLLASPVALFKALGDEVRLKSLLLMDEEGEVCVCELMAALNESQPKISRHLALLRESGVVTDRRQAQWVFYRLSPALPAWIAHLLRATRMGNAAWIRAEQQRLASMSGRPERAVPCCSKPCSTSTGV